MRLLRAIDYRRMPWKNGGGETREILVWPPGATLEALDRRVSVVFDDETSPVGLSAAGTANILMIALFEAATAP